MAPICSVIFPTYNRAEVLAQCLEHLLVQDVGADRLQVVVIDDGSTDATPEVLQRPWPFGDFVVRRQANAGPGAARNAGLAHATAPLSLLMNDDTLLAPDAIAVHLAAHAERDAVAVLGSFDYVPAFAATPLGHLCQDTTVLFQYALLQPGDLCDHNFSYTCNLSVPTGVARAVGFDESFRYFAEDIDFGYRLAQRGFRVWYRPDAVSWHDHAETLDGIARKLRTRARGGVRFTAKHHPDRWVPPASRAQLEELEHSLSVAVLGLRILLDAAGPERPLDPAVYLRFHEVVGFADRLGAGEEAAALAAV